jgi:hypothetical protein
MVKNKPNRPLNQSFQKDAPVSDTQLLTISHESVAIGESSNVDSDFAADTVQEP